MRGRVAILPGYGEPVEIREYDVPAPEPGGLIVKIEQATVCGSDLHVWRAETAAQSSDPAALGFGHEGFGRIVALGSGTTVDDAGQRLAVGDRVVHGVTLTSTGRGPRPEASRVYGEFPYFFTTFADYYYVSANRPVYRVPDALSDDVLPPVNCAMGAAIAGLLRGGAGFGSHVVIFGAGGLGLAAAAAARYAGASSVTVFDRLADRLALATAFGADRAVNVDDYPAVEDRVALVQDATRGGADVVLELVGRAELFPEGVAMLAPAGTFVNVGLWYRGTAAAFDPSEVFRGQRRIIGSSGYPHTLLPKILDFLVRTKDDVPWERMVSHRFPLADINEALAQADWAGKGGAVTRAAIVP